MNMKPKLTIRLLLLGVAAAALTACSDWTEMETVENQVNKPWEQDPELWAEYTAALRAYKQSEHFIVYARLHNSPEKSSSEQDFMRCLPDSLDIVTLTNADNFSEFDAEDMAVMHEKGTRVLYQIDYAARKSEFADTQALDAYLERVIAAVAANGMNGYSFTTDPLAAEATARIVEKLSAAKSEGQIIVFEGSPLSLADDDRARIDYIALDTEKIENVQEVKLQILNATGYAGIAPEKAAAFSRNQRPPVRRGAHGVCGRRRDGAPRRRVRSGGRSGCIQHLRRLLPCGDELPDHPHGDPDVESR